ncbi:hypothetical protein PBRA_009555 [Plasmodiophora brassicae]|uniref:Uncharacterized protein n=1 Tax=Plasmodiophora brassicae TaxID=37360 RepID=A0A0G4J8R0_PLABS|nr:hypothetical protein PBRA_009555 [Plasmodiophora brassicae]
MSDANAAFAVFKQRDADAAAANKALKDVRDANPDDPRLAGMERDADRAGAARDAALAAYVASRPAAPPAEDTTTLVGDWFLVAARKTVAHVYALFRRPGPDWQQLGSTADSSQRRYRQHAPTLSPIPVGDGWDRSAVPVPVSSLQSPSLRAGDIRRRAKRK